MSICSLNTAKYGPQITPYLDTFHAVIPMYNMIEYRKSYPKTFRSLWQCSGVEWALNNASNVIDVFANNNNNNNNNNNSVSFKFKEEITGQTGVDDAKNVEIMVPLNYLCNF